MGKFFTLLFVLAAIITIVGLDIKDKISRHQKQKITASVCVEMRGYNYNGSEFMLINQYVSEVDTTKVTESNKKQEEKCARLNKEASDRRLKKKKAYCEMLQNKGFSNYQEWSECYDLKNEQPD